MKEGILYTVTYINKTKALKRPSRCKRELIWFIKASWASTSECRANQCKIHTQA